MLKALLDRFYGDGDAAAMEAVVRRTRGRLLAIAGRIGAPQDAEDSVQAAYHALLRHGAFRGPVTVEAWLTTAVVRIAYRRKALARREVALADRLARDGGADPYVTAVLREEASVIRREVARLPAGFRDVLVLRHLEGLSVEETGRLLDIPQATVKTRTRRGLTLLRARVAPRAAWALLAGPWLLADGIRSATQWGLVMNAKTTFAMAGVALAAAAAGLGSGILLGGSREPQAPRAPGRDPTHVARAEPDAMAHWRDRAEKAEAALEAMRTARAPAAEPMPQVAASPPAFEARLAEAGRMLGAGPAALAAARRARTAQDEWVKTMSAEAQVEFTAAVEALRLLGPEGFLATVAHLRATDAPRLDYVVLLDATYRPGLESHLLALAGDPAATPGQRRHAILGLSIADTLAVRTHLLAVLESGADERLVAAAAQSIGWLHDERAVPIMERMLYRPGKERDQGPLLDGLAAIGSKEARRVLVEYLGREHRSGYLAWGVRALASSDMEAARDAAAAILAGPHAGKLAPADRYALEGTAKR